ncbi:uncharacterized protein LOC123257184 [Drosophila ananassae]|uniref:uncharacterized protein LOC123257184 n=1 Tax=Drosophila ananassae TaxID=7217 RepID=UPI000177CCD1|nr:uncharacterized protein LOC123257184 [Drosophila ananassae]
MVNEVQNKSPLGVPRSLGYALKRRNDRFVVEPIGGIINPAYEPDLGGDVSALRERNTSWQVY